MHARNVIARIAGFAIAAILGITPVSALAESRARIYTPEQVLKFGADAARVSDIPGPSTDTATHLGTKTLANGLYMTGSFAYTISSGSVTLTVDQINNDSFTATTGTLRLEMWASTTRPARGTGFTGYQLAVSSTLAPMGPRTFYSNVSRTASFLEPPAGTYWLVLLLTEFNPACTGNYCVTDSGIFSNQRTFGSPPPTGNVTVASQAGEQCYENVPQDVFNFLQQVTPNLFQSYPSGISCAQLGMPFYAGLLATNTSVRVYATDSTVGQVLCSSGALTACTNPVPSGPTYTDIWWNPAESGWGVTITHHPSGNAFIAWYTYDSSGNPKWYVAPNCLVTNAGCTGTLYETNGPALGAVFNAALVTARSVGSVTFAFSGPTTGLMSYNVRGITGIKLITRQPF